MKKVLFFTIFICCISLIIESSDNSENNEFKTDSYSSSINSDYVIKEYNGCVAIFSVNGDSPIEVLDCKIKNLPPDAAQALVTGIKVSGEDELQKIIEAYD